MWGRPFMYTVIGGTQSPHPGAPMPLPGTNLGVHFKKTALYGKLVMSYADPFTFGMLYNIQLNDGDIVTVKANRLIVDPIKCRKSKWIPIV